MKRNIWTLVFFIMLSGLVLAQTKNWTFEQVTDRLDQNKKTALAAKNFWNTIKGSEVAWSGAVYDVKGGRGKAQILVANKARKTYKGYNIVLITYNMDAAAKLEIGQKIRFSGYLNKYKGRKGHPVILYLTDVQILK